MNSVTLLVDCILLLLLESKANLENESSQMIQKLLDYQESTSTRWNVSDDSITMKLSTIIASLLSSVNKGEPIDVDRTVRILKIETATTSDLEGDEDLRDTILDMIKSVESLDGDELYRYIDNIRASVSDAYNNEALKRFLQSQTMDMNKRNNSKSFRDRLESLRVYVDKLEDGSGDKDDAILFELDLDDLSKPEVVEKLESSIVTKHIFRTGWKGINRMYQGGRRVPEFSSVGALTHNYKSGYHLSIFASIVLYNKPIMRDKGKPLAVYFSFEDDVMPIFEFLYQLLYITETGSVLKEISVKPVDMVRDVAKKLQAKGFAVKIIKIDPTRWSYVSFVNKVKRYIAQGYDPQIVDVDYFEKLPTTGIDANGPMGYDKKVLVRKVRNFLASIDASGSTPWQLSSKASDLKKDGLTDKDFLSFVAPKQYYQGSATLGNEMDLETFTNIVETNDNGCWLNIHMGKHKIPTVVDKKYKSYFLPYPQNGPIPFDIELENEIGSYDIKTPNPFY